MLIMKAGDLTVGHDTANPTTGLGFTGLENQVFIGGLPVICELEYLFNHGTPNSHSPLCIVNNRTNVFVNRKEVWKVGDPTNCGDIAAAPTIVSNVFAGIV